MAEERSPGGVGVVLVALFVVALFVYFVGTIAEIVLLVFVSIILAVYFGVVTNLIIRWLRVPRPAALALAVLLTAAAAIGAAALIVPPVAVQVRELWAALPDLTARFETTMAGWTERLRIGGGTPPPDGAGLLDRTIADATSFIGDSFVPYLTAGGRFLVEFVSVVAMGVYFAQNPRMYQDGAVTLFPPSVRHIARQTLDDLADTMRLWVGGQAIAMTFLAAVTALGLWVLRVPYALAFGVFTGVAAIVPFFGTVTSTIVPAAFVLATGAPAHALAVLMLGVLVHLVEANVVYPLIFKARIQLPPVLTLIAILASVLVLGVLGLIVAVPLLATIIVVVRHVLIGEIYGDAPAGPRGKRRSAVLVPTEEHEAISAIP